MARQTLERNVKFKCLVRALKIPRPHVRGYLETMWDVAGECGNPVLGTPTEVEAAAEWAGEDGALFAALREGRWIDEVEGRKGIWEIHDYFDHAPDYVHKRRARELARQERAVEMDAERPSTADNGRQRHTTADNGAERPHSQLLHPSQTQVETSSTAPAREAGGDFDAFWAAYPNKTGKGDARKVWRRLVKTRPPLSEILAAVARQKSWQRWREGYVPNPATWLRQERWLDETPPEKTGNGPSDSRRAAGAHDKPQPSRVRTI